MNINPVDNYAEAIQKLVRDMRDDVEYDLPPDTLSFCNVENYPHDMQTLVIAIAAGNTFQTARSLYEFTGFVANEQCLTLLSLAASMGRVNVMELLLRSGQEVDGKNTDGSTALHFAASFNRGEAIDCLLKHGANVNASDDNGMDALKYAAREPNRVRAIHRLLNAGAFIEKGATECSPLFLSCQLVDCQNTLLLILRRANLNSVDSLNRTLLWVICNSDLQHDRHDLSELFEAARMLIAFGVDVNAIDIDGNHVIHSLMLDEHNSSENIILMLQIFFDLRPDVDLSCRNNNGFTPLHLCVYMKDDVHVIDEKVFIWLVNHGADPTVCDLRGNSVLHHLAATNFLLPATNVLNILRQRNISSSIMNGAGITPRELALRQGQVEMAEPIFSYSDECTAQLWAAKTNWGLRTHNTPRTPAKSRFYSRN
jgi:serine/threonine-protein phosphatase 6 regulatory ankyrin repeat subunit B